MKAISLKASGMPKITLSRVTDVIVTNRAGLGVMGASLCFLGCLLSTDAMMWTGAAIAMLSVKPSAEKGGER